MKFNKEVILAMANAISVFAMAQEATAPEDSAVEKLTVDNFNEFLSDNSLVLAEFYANWCGHCKRLGPEFVAAADELKEDNIRLAQIDCTEEQSLCNDQGVRSYPTLKVFRHGTPEQGVDYEGGRTKKSIVDYMRKQALPAVNVLEGGVKSKEFKKILEEATTPIILNGGKKTKFNETFHELADNFRNQFTFIQLSEDDTPLAVYLPKEEEAIVYKKSDTDFESLKKWLFVERLPYFGEVSQETYSAYMGSGLPIGYYFYTTPEQREALEGHFTKLAKKYRGDIAFTALDASKYGKFADNMNMKEQFPLFAIHNTTSDSKYGLPQLSEEEYEALSEPVLLKEKDITGLVEDFLAGKAEPIIKSEPIPETQETNVFKLVGRTHNEIVNDPKKDVLVKYYAPWCGHCKTLAPVYEELADVYASDKDASDKVLVADIDATLNDVGGVPIVGFPTIILYPAGENSEPVTYNEGDRSIKSLLEFVQEHGTHKVDGATIHENLEPVEKESEEQATEEEPIEEDKPKVEEEQEEEHDEL